MAISKLLVNYIEAILLIKKLQFFELPVGTLQMLLLPLQGPAKKIKPLFIMYYH